MGGLSIWHILIVAVLILLLFGGNRFSAMMGDVAKGLKSFKKGMADEEEERRQEARPLPRNHDRPIDVTPEPGRTAEPTRPTGEDDQR